MRSSWRCISSVNELSLPSTKLRRRSSSLRCSTTEFDLRDRGRAGAAFGEDGYPDQPVAALGPRGVHAGCTGIGLPLAGRLEAVLIAGDLVRVAHLEGDPRGAGDGSLFDRPRLSQVEDEPDAGFALQLQRRRITLCGPGRRAVSICRELGLFGMLAVAPVRV